jgi:hypothetical protein
MTFLVKSTLGNFLRFDGEDYVREARDAAQFATEEAADNFIRQTYGRNGFKYYRVVWKGERNEDDGE